MGFSTIFKYWLLSRLFPEKKGNHYQKKFLSVIEEEYKALKKAENEKNGIYDYEGAYQKYLQSEQHDTSPKILFEVESVRFFKSLTGIQRVVWSVLNVMMNKGVPGYQICPVYMTDYGLIKANRFMSEKFGIQNGLDDEYFEITGNDIFLSLDINFNYVLNAKFQKQFSDLRAKGVKTYFFLYDLIAIKFPEFCDNVLLDPFNQYIRFISYNNDGIITDSKAVADEYSKWLEANMPWLSDKQSVTWTHLGYDIQNYSFTTGLPEESSAVFEAIGKRQTCLMVSTIEPRKGYRETLAAFERLWSKGIDANLIIVGREGWKMPDFVQNLREHAEYGKRLFWLSGISDEYLEKLYQLTTGVLMASFSEGFGLAIIECAGHGKPLLCRNIPVFEEIAGDHAMYFSEDQPEPFADAIATWFDLISKGQAPDTRKIKALTWKDMTDNLLKAVLPQTRPDK